VVCRRHRNCAVREIVVLSYVRRTGVIILAIAVCSSGAFQRARFGRNEYLGRGGARCGSRSWQAGLKI
jgi:hypothetical protein